MIERLFSGATIVAAGTVAATASTASPYTWLAPIACGCLAALIVRGIAISTPTTKRRVWTFEALVTALSVLLTGVIAEERGLTIMYATFAGVGIGGMGVGVISIARTAAGTMITNLARSILSATPSAPEDDSKAGDP